MRTIGMSGLALLAVSVPVNGTAQDRSGAKGPSGNPQTFFSVGDYPAEAIRAKEQGRVAVLVSIDATGKVVGCRIDVSSGSASLDQVTCNVALTRIRYQPASDEQGRAIASTSGFAVQWSLPDADGPVYMPIRSVSSSVEDVVNGDGTVTSCVFKVDGKVEQAPQPCSGSARRVAEALPSLTVREKAGFVLTSQTRQEYAGNPPPSPPDTTGRVLKRDVIRFSIEADGKAVNCRRDPGGRAVSAPPCAGAPPFESRTTEPASVIEGSWTSIIAVRPTGTAGS